MNDAIISIKPKHVENILTGLKTVELRTRAFNLPEGSKLWIYTTLPVGKVKLTTEIDFVDTDTPEVIWKKYYKQICISKDDFDAYTADRRVVSAIGLKSVTPLDKAICLDTLRQYESGFQPPQFFARVHPNRPLYTALTVN